MSKEQLTTICKIIQHGAPALANELITAIADLIKENADLKEKVNAQTTVEKEA